LNNFSLKIFLVFSISFSAIIFDAHSQDGLDYGKQLWAMTFFSWKLNDRWIYNQDFGYQHSFETPTYTGLFLRSQLSYQLSGLFSLHGGLNFINKIHGSENNAIELRPWLGAKLRWPYFWRFNFSQYLRFEQRFEHTIDVYDWENNFRVRYKLSSNVPINHASLIDKTLYGVIAYEFFSYSFGDDVRFTSAATHRFDLGLGYRQNVKTRYEAQLVAFNSRDEITEQYSFSNFVLFLKFKRYINWG
jgi:hypothetical protein